MRNRAARHPRSEERERDRVRDTRARSRMKKRQKRGMVKPQQGGAKEDAVATPWRMDGKNVVSSESPATAGESLASHGATQEPLTEELLHELLDAPSPVAFTDLHGIGQRSLPAYLDELLAQKKLKRSDVVRAAGLNETFGYQIFKGQRNPSRDKVLQIAFAMALSLRETNRLLKAGGANELYCKNRRDAIMIFCIDHAYSLQKTNEELYRFGEETLG